MSDKIRIIRDAGIALRKRRLQRGVSATDLARTAGRSRDTLHRLETGDDVSLATFLAFVQALGGAIEIVSAGLPTLEEMQRRFDPEQDDE